MVVKPLILRVEDEEEIWYKFLAITNGLQPIHNQLTDLQLRVVAYICTQDPRKDHFRGTFLVKMDKKFPDVNRAHLAVIKTKLKAKGWITTAGSGDEVLAPHIRVLVEKVYASKLEANFTTLEFTFRITTKTLQEDLHD